MYIKVNVSPGAKKEKIDEYDDNRFRIAVRQKAERNMANDRVRELIAEHFGVTVSCVKIINGHRSQSKLLSIREE